MISKYRFSSEKKQFMLEFMSLMTMLFVNEDADRQDMAEESGRETGLHGLGSLTCCCCCCCVVVVLAGTEDGYANDCCCCCCFWYEFTAELSPLLAATVAVLLWHLLALFDEIGAADAVVGKQLFL